MSNNNNNNKQPAQSNTPEMTVIGRDTQIKGEMFFENSAKILGSFEGKITAQGEIQINNGANCNAAIEAQRVIVDGKVTGPIVAHEQLTLTANAQVQGDLTAGSLIVSEGASFVGQCNVGPAAQEMFKKPQAANATKEIKNNQAAKVDLTPPWATTNQPAQEVA